MVISKNIIIYNILVEHPNWIKDRICFFECFGTRRPKCWDLWISATPFQVAQTCLTKTSTAKKNDIKFYQVFTVCSNANNEVCPVWPEKDKIIHWDLDDPVVKIQKAKSDDEINSIIANTYNIIEKKIEDWIKDA